MVESHAEKTEEKETEDKNFTEDPAILDKFKAASVITDGRHFPISIAIYSFFFVQRP